jgi:hypothetical protein
VHRRFTTKLCDVGDHPDVYTQHDCSHNEIVSLHNRHLKDNNPAPEWLVHTEKGTRFISTKEVLPGYTQQCVYKVAQRVAKRWVANREVHPISYTQYIEGFSGLRKRRLMAANITNTYRCPASKVDAFIKVDAYDLETATNKAPRMIQHRGPQASLELAIWLTPAEHELLGGRGLGPSGLPTCSKGMSMTRRAEVWLRKRMCFSKPVCFKADYSAFDAHVHTHSLALEHLVWKRMCPGINKDLLRGQYENKGRTMHGTEYVAVGTRMSGDRNTGGGNSVLNTIIAHTVAEIAGVVIEMLCDGDDSMVWMEEGDVEKFAAVAAIIIPCVFGMKWGYEVATTLEEEEYCHSRLVTDGHDAWCVRDPERVLTRLQWTTKGCVGVEAVELLRGKATADYLSSEGVYPVQLACYNILQATSGLGVTLDKGAQYRLGMTESQILSTNITAPVRRPELDSQVCQTFDIHPAVYETWVRDASTVRLSPFVAEAVGRGRKRQPRTKPVLVEPTYDHSGIPRDLLIRSEQAWGSA